MSGVRQSAAGAGTPVGEDQGNPRRADRGHQHHLRQRGRLPVLRPARLTDIPHLLRNAEKRTRGLNALLASEQNRFSSGNGAFVFWTRDESGFDIFASIDAPEPDRVRALLASVRRGRWTTVDDGPFYALSLSASGGRAVVRDWMDTTVGHAKQQLARWFDRQRITLWC